LVIVAIVARLVSLESITGSHVYHFGPNVLEMLLVVLLVFEGLPGGLVLRCLPILTIDVQVAPLGY
jgi:hypothetical protein